MAPTITVTAPPKQPRAPNGVLVDPAETTDDVIEKIDEMPPAFTLLASRVTTESDFDTSTLKVYSFTWAVPHLVVNSATKWADDTRGALVELIRTGVSFRNISNQEITIHANTPVALQTVPTAIYARIAGFYSKGKKKGRCDDVRLKPGQTATYKTHWKNLPNEYIPLRDANDGRTWMNIVSFCVEMKNINDSTGAAMNDLASVVSMIPKVNYTKRQSNPDPPAGVTLEKQGGNNFQLHELAGSDDLYSVDPVSAPKSYLTPFSADGTRSSNDVVIDQNTSWIFDAMVEGDLLGVQRVGTKKGTKGYDTCGLVVKRVGGNERPLDLGARQGVGNRIIITGLCVGAAGGCAYSYFKWDQGLGHWVLWDDYEQMPRAITGTGTLLTPITTRSPLMFLTGVYTLAEKEELEQTIRASGRSSMNQPYGSPKGFGNILREAISVLIVVGKIAVAVGGILL